MFRRARAKFFNKPRLADPGFADNESELPRTTRARSQRSTTAARSSSRPIKRRYRATPLRLPPLARAIYTMSPARNALELRGDPAPRQ